MNNVDGIIMDPEDNVGTLYRTVTPGEEVHLVKGEEYSAIVVKEQITAGHKCALTNIEKADDIVKYGEKIGFASTPIKKGTHVHTHNIKSYHGRGDEND